MNCTKLLWLAALPFAFGLGCSSAVSDQFYDVGGSAGWGVGGMAGAAGTNAAGTTVIAGGRGAIGGGSGLGAGGVSAGAGGTKPTGGTGGFGGVAGVGGSKAGSGGAGGASGAGGTLVTGGTGACDTSDPPANVKAWIDESWNAEGKPNITSRSAWLADSAMKGKGQINVCVRWGATATLSAANRDKIGTQMELWFNQWFSKLYPYDCFPYPKITVKVTGYAVRPGKESLMPAGTTPIYTDQESGSDPAGEPKCPDNCGLFFNWSHSFTNCKGGEEAHFDYSLWLDDQLPGGGGAAAVGGDWGLRMPVGGFINLGTNPNNVTLHEMGHGFGLSDYYSWTGSRPAGGSIMIVGSTNSSVPTEADQWIVRRYWKETKALRYP